MSDSKLEAKVDALTEAVAKFIGQSADNLSEQQRREKTQLSEMQEWNTREVQAQVDLAAARGPNLHQDFTMSAPLMSEGGVMLTIRGTLHGYKMAANDKHPGEFFVSGVVRPRWDFGEGPKLIEARIRQEMGVDRMTDAARLGDRASMIEIDRIVNDPAGPRGTGGLPFRVYHEIEVPILRLIVGRTVEQLVAAGTIKLVGEPRVVESRPLPQ